VGNVLIVQAGSKMRYLGRIDLDVEDDRATDVQCRLVPLWTAGYDGSAKVDSMVARFEEDIQEEYGKVIARSEATLGRNSEGESDLGNWLTDRLRAVTGADVAFLNSGGIRDNLAAGEVTKLDIQEILPFSNAVCTFACTGEELIAMVENNLLAGVTGDHGVLQSSGLVVSWGLAGDKVWVSHARLGAPGDDDAPAVDPEGTYTVATVDYVAISQPEKYLGYRPVDVQGTGTVLTDAIMEDVEKTGTIARPAGRRMIQEKSVEPAAGAIGHAG
jgi:2',3'-cyclic-nucleotide 2'-phosphodiesterase (5'-nucleotidase family)